MRRVSSYHCMVALVLSACAMLAQIMDALEFGRNLLYLSSEICSKLQTHVTDVRKSVAEAPRQQQKN